MITRSEVTRFTECSYAGAKRLGMLFGLVFLAYPVLSGAQVPTIKLFPTTVLEEIKQTGSVAKEMEIGLQETIAQLDQQQQLFMESKCEGSEDDPGCAEISKQMGKTYLKMLDIMGEKLPEMEEAVNNTKTSLETRLRKELGRKMTPWDLQEMLLGKKQESPLTSRPMLRGRSGVRLSDRFNQYYRLVATTGKSGNASLAVIASDIFLDMSEASDLIARTREEISRASLMGKLNESFGTITPEMQEVVAGVKGILFGDFSDDISAGSPPIGSRNTEYQSPLQL